MEEKKFSVYMHINRINNKRYVGITSQSPKKRWGKNGIGYNKQPYFWRAIQKYGWENFEHIVITDNLQPNEAYLKEQELISQYQLTDVNFGYNQSIGGEKGSLGSYNGSTSKIIYQYDLDGNFIKEWKSAHEIGRQFDIGFSFSNICRCCRKSTPTISNGYQWSYVYSEKIEPIMSKEARTITGSIKTVYQYNLDGSFVNSYISATKAAEENHNTLTSISQCCCGTIETSGGFIWTYTYTDSMQPTLSPHVKKGIKRFRSVNQYDLNGVFLKNFKSIKEAMIDLKIKSGSNISSCCNGKRNIAYGFIWSYS